MKDHGTVRSTTEPLELEITDTKVFVASDINQITTTVESQEMTEFEFNLVEYTKDEYIKLQSEINSSLEEQMETTQEVLDFLLMG